jgi:GNAT superfamily N-acetyltransferase
MGQCMADDVSDHVWVTYLELREAPSLVVPHRGSERIGLETMTREAYLALYRSVGEPLRWDQRLMMPAAELDALLAGDCLHLYVVRNADAIPLGFCEFDRSAFPEIELKHFGLVPASQGLGIGPWLLAVGLRQEWASGANRIWLHTDTWDHPAAVPVYKRAGFQVYAVRYEPAALL